MASKRMTKAEREQAELKAEQRKDEAIRRLRKLLRFGSTVYTVLRNRSRNRVGGVIAVLIIHKRKIVNISNLVSDATGMEWDDSDGVWSNSEYGVVSQISEQIHGLESKGKRVHAEIATPNNFQAGYTLVHKQL